MSISERTLLLVDDEENILRSLVRLLRREGYRLLTANSAAAALEVLAQNDVQVIVSDQRMPGMTGSELFKQVRQSYPDTVRMILSGYTDLASVTDAVNEGAIFRFLTKPWDDLLLSENIREAFAHFEARRHAAADAAPAPATLERQVLDALPFGVLAVDGAGVIALANPQAGELLEGAVAGSAARGVLPPEILERYQHVTADCATPREVLPGQRGGAVDVVVQATGDAGGAVAVLVLLMPALAAAGKDPATPSGPGRAAAACLPRRRDA